MFKTQVRVRLWDPDKTAYTHVWRDIRPSGGKPCYVYPTREAAELACRKANDGGQTREDYRVVDVNEIEGQP